jgi:hypothetical protein
MKKTDEYNGPFPVIELEGSSFYVNAYQNEFVQVDDPGNCIGMQDMMCYTDHMELWFDSGTKTVYEGPHTGKIPDAVKIFWFYPFGAMDPLGRNAAMDETQPCWRKDYPTDLPVIKIAGKDFFVDERRNAFRDTKNCWNTISFADVCKRNGETGIYIDINVVQVPFPHAFDDYYPAHGLPENIVFAIVPDGHRLAVLLNDWGRDRDNETDQNEKRQVGR